MRNSRLMITIATHAGIAFSGTRQMNAAAIITLSASGSISFPKFVTMPSFLAIVPVEIVRRARREEEQQRRGVGKAPARLAPGRVKFLPLQPHVIAATNAAVITKREMVSLLEGSCGRPHARAAQCHRRRFPTNQKCN